MSDFDHRILALLEQQRESPEKFRPERGFEPECSAPASQRLVFESPF